MLQCVVLQYVLLSGCRKRRLVWIFIHLTVRSQVKENVNLSNFNKGIYCVRMTDLSSTVFNLCLDGLLHVFIDWTESQFPARLVWV